MLNQAIDVPVPAGRIERVEHVRVAGAQVIFDKGAGFELQGVEVADPEQAGRQVQLQEVTGGLRVGEEGLEHGIVWGGGGFAHDLPAAGDDGLGEQAT